MRRNAVSATASTIAKKKSTTIATIADELAAHGGLASAHRSGRVSVSGGADTGRQPFPSSVTEPVEQLLFAPAHHGRLFGFGVVVVQQVQHAVDDEQRELVVEGAPRSPACRCATVGQTTTSPSSVGGSPGSVGAPGPRPPWSGWRPPGGSSSSIGNASTSVGPLAAEEAFVQLGDRRLVDEQQRHLGVGAEALDRRVPRRARARASRTQRATSMATSRCSSAPNTRESWLRRHVAHLARR